MTLRVSYLEYMLLLIDIILALFRSPVFSLIDTCLFTVGYIHVLYSIVQHVLHQSLLRSLLNTLIRIVLSILS